MTDLMGKKEFAEWKQEPITRLLFKYLKSRKADFMNILVYGTDEEGIERNRGKVQLVEELEQIDMEALLNEQGNI